VFPTGDVENMEPSVFPALSRLKEVPKEFFQLIAILIDPLRIE
jgi:hypothetical protein